MPRFIYSQEMLSFLADHFPKHIVRELTEMFNREFGTNKSSATIKSVLHNHKIRCGVKRTKREDSRQYSDEQISWMKENYPAMIATTLLVKFNEHFGTSHKLSAFKSALKKHNCTGFKSRYWEKGCTPWNTGMKGLRNGGDAGFFKPGNIPANHKPVGSERFVNGYKEVKIAEPNIWKPKHQIAYEKSHGPIPEDKILHFLDNNKSNCSVDNLALISRPQGVLMNKLGLSSVPCELKTTAITLVDIAILAKKREAE